MSEENSTFEATPPMGVEHPGVIDQFALDPRTGEVVLVMVETRPWQTCETQLLQVQEKLNAYASFILDGEMVEAYPQVSGKRVRVRLECPDLPGEEEAAFFQHVYEQLALQEIAFEVDVRNRPSV